MAPLISGALLEGEMNLNILLVLIIFSSCSTKSIALGSPKVEKKDIGNAPLSNLSGKSKTEYICSGKKVQASELKPLQTNDCEKTILTLGNGKIIEFTNSTGGPPNGYSIHIVEKVYEEFALVRVAKGEDDPYGILINSINPDEKFYLDGIKEPLISPDRKYVFINAASYASKEPEVTPAGWHLFRIDSGDKITHELLMMYKDQNPNIVSCKVGKVCSMTSFKDGLFGQFKWVSNSQLSGTRCIPGDKTEKEVCTEVFINLIDGKWIPSWDYN